ncbi:MAG: class I SAM-dependent methyltransferase [Prochloraceae cyanobacterium]
MNLTLEKDLIQKITEVYQEYIKNNPHDEIPNVLQNDILIRKRVASFSIYKKYLTGKNTFLDWGCKNGIIGYTIKTYLGDRAGKIEIHGCDIIRGKYQIFSEKANLIYSQLNHYYLMPYQDNYFDIVIGNGVLEHVANDRESLKELYRIIKNEGYLIITFLPNRLSYTEFLSEKFRKLTHMRKYSINKIKEMLLHSGFVPIEWGYHQVFPSLSSFPSRRVSDPKDLKRLNDFKVIMSKIYNLNKYAEKIWPLNIFATNIFIIAQRKAMIP